MKRLITCLIALALMICTVVSVSAEVSPTATAVNPPSPSIDINLVGPVDPGTALPDNPVKVIDNGDGTYTIIWSKTDGFQFSHWDFVGGKFEIISGDITSSTITIRPTTNDPIKVDVHFTEDEVPVTAPSTHEVYPPDPGNNSPITGDAVVVYTVIGSVMALAVVALIVLKKKANA